MDKHCDSCTCEEDQETLSESWRRLQQEAKMISGWAKYIRDNPLPNKE